MKILALTLTLLGAHFAAAATPSYVVVDTIAIGGEARWDYLTVDSVHHRLYASHGMQTEVIDMQTDKRIATIDGTAGVHGIAIASDLGLGFISNGKTDSVTVFDLASLKHQATIKVGANPDAIVYDARSRRVVTFNGRSHDTSIIDARRGEVVGTVAVGGKPEFAQVAASGEIFFNIEDTGELAVLDPVHLRLLRRHALKPCDSPSGLAIDDQQRLYSVCENGMMIVSAADGSRLGQSAIGAGPDGVVWLDGVAFSANGVDGTISAVKAAAAGGFETVETLVSAHGARTIAADPATHRLYLPTADFSAAEAGAKRVGLPDTFLILVFERK